MRFCVLVLVGQLAGCGSVSASGRGDGDGAPALADAALDASPASHVVLRYDFDAGLVDDGGARFVPDVGGDDRRGLVVGAVGGEALLEVVPREEGTGDNAIQFPGACQEADPASCPRVILEAEDSADQNPGERDFAVTLELLVPTLPAGSPVLDENLAQKGNFDDPGQWKIEIDLERRVSCVFHYPDDDGMPTIAKIQRAVDDGVWHLVRCERRGDLLLASLDAGEGSDTRSVEIAPGDKVDLTSARPIRIGGQNVTAAGDQFHGSLDNVAIEIF